MATTTTTTEAKLVKLLADKNLVLAICLQALEEIAESVNKTDENGFNADIACEALKRIKQIETLD